MTITNEELTAIYNEANPDRRPMPVPSRCLAAMRLAMEKEREEEKEAIDSGKNVMHALLLSRNDDEVASQWARQTPARGIVGGESETEIIDETGEKE